MKPLILHMRACNFFGGPERIILGHISHSKNYYHKVLGFSENGVHNELVEVCIRNGFGAETLWATGPFDPGVIARLRTIFKTTKPDLICSHGYKPTILSLMAKIGLNIPLIVFSHGHTGENIKVQIFEALETKALRYTDAVVAVSMSRCQYLQKKGVPHRSIYTVHNAFDLENLRPFWVQAAKKRYELGFSGKEVLIASAGRFSPEKAFDNLIQAFARIHKLFPEVHLLLAGDGPTREKLQETAREQGIQNIHFIGFRRDMDVVMCAIDLFVISSRTEGLPLVLLEAFAAKKPVVATAVGGIPEVLENGVSGYLVPPGRPDLLAEAIVKMLSDPERMQAMGRAGYERVREDFTFEAQTEKLEGIYRKVIGSRCTAQAARG